LEKNFCDFFSFTSNSSEKKINEKEFLSDFGKIHYLYHLSFRMCFMRRFGQTLDHLSHSLFLIEISSTKILRRID